MYCPKCGTKNDDNNFRCENCQEILQSMPTPMPTPPATRSGTGAVVGTIIAIVIGVVLMMVIVMAAILFPVFARAREAAIKSHCQTNLMEIGSALRAYCADNNEVLPSSALARQKKWNQAAFVSFAGGNLGNATWSSALSRNLVNPEVLHCHSDKARQDAKAPVSYYWKAAVDYAWFQGFKKQSSFAFPADQIIMYEHNGWHWGQTSQGLTNGVMINCLFMDGHVCSKRISNTGYSVSENPPSPLPQNGVGEPAWYNYDFANSQGPTTAKLWDPSRDGDCLP